MLLGKVYFVRTNLVNFEFRPNDKFTVVQGDSACGKTQLIMHIFANSRFTNILTFNGSIKMISETQDALIAMDESHFNNCVQQYGPEIFNKSPNCFLLIIREIPHCIPINHRSIYRLVHSDNKYSLQRIYKDYNTFEESLNYLTEDTRSGYLYFRKHLPNVKTAKNKDNIINVLEQDTTVIADAAGIGNCMSRLLSTKKRNVKLFLPDSFEGLVLCYTKSATTYFNKAHTDVVLSYKSSEDYFTHVFKQVFDDKYNKSKLPDSVLQKDIMHDYILVDNNLLNHLYCIKNNIDDLDFCLKEIERLRKVFNIDASPVEVLDYAVKEFNITL